MIETSRRNRSDILTRRGLEYRADQSLEFFRQIPTMACYPTPRAGLRPVLTRLYRLAYQSIGVIYGDIGTSPLYVYSSTFSSEPSHDDLFGALSLIIWTLTLMVSVKYILIVLRADDEGEGGTFAVYSLLSRYVRALMSPPGLSSTEWQRRLILSVVTPVRRDRSK